MLKTMIGWTDLTATYLQEDSVLINKTAVENGMFVSTFFRTFHEQNNKAGNSI